MAQIVDYSFARPGAQAIRDANYAGAMRYLAPRPNEKVWDAEQVREHQAAGLWIGMVWETSTGRPLEGRDAGVSDATRANDLADELGAPSTVGIYYACDRPDLTPAQVQPYFEGVLSVGRRSAGVYGSREVVEAMVGIGCRYGWQVETWTDQWYTADGHVVGKWDAAAVTPIVTPYAQLVQLPNVQPRVGGTDANDVRSDDWGGWAPYTDAAPVVPTTPAPATAPFDWPTLRRGMSGPAVREMQQVLANRGWTIDVDGDFGSKTADVVLRFQQEKFSDPADHDGVVGPRTKDMMLNSPTSSSGGDQVPDLGVMRRGDSGPNVKALQSKLADRGWSIGVDGGYGRETENVVLAFQREKFPDDPGEQDGIAGPHTVHAIWTLPYDDAPMPPAPPLDPPLPPPPPAGNPGTPHPDAAAQIAAWGFYGPDGAVAMFQQSFALWDLGVDGDAGDETAKAVQAVVDNGGYLSPHFSIAEWACKHCGRIKAHRETFRSLEAERELVGPIAIVSGHRCDDHNAAIGGAPLSQHRFGTAGDKNTKVWSSEQAGFTGIGTCGDDCLHGDRGDVGENPTRTAGQPTFWSYC